jgi:hypothetical protein
MSDEQSFDAVDAVFDTIAGGKQRIKYSDVLAHFDKSSSLPATHTREIRAVYDLIDADRNGSISKLEFVAAVMRNSDVANFVMPGVDNKQVLHDEEAFDMVNSLFETISGGKQRIYIADFEEHFRQAAAEPPRAPVRTDRAGTRVFVIGPGFGQQLNPRQGALIHQAGFQVQWCHSVPNPEQPSFVVQPYLEHLRREIDAFRPDVVAAASKGGVYVVGLWQMGIWRGPTLLLNAHPSCQQLPEGVPVVVAHGSNDEVYSRSRSELEQLISSGTANRCFLYYTADSGYLRGGQRSRVGDMHNMESLLSHECLPRLLDCTLARDGPEMHMVRTWRERLGADRQRAEDSLGYSPERLRRRWSSRSLKGMAEQKLFDVPRGSQEFFHVQEVFHSVPAEPPAYLLSPQATWDRTRILKVERIENGLQHEGSAKPYYESLRRSLDDQGLQLELGAHTRWAFHGADDQAIESIIHNPVAGFQPLASGSRNASLWGSGTYFARDPKYVADGGFCGAPAADGSRKMLMCLLMSGMPCLGDPQHKGVLPFRQKPHRYHSSVDALSSPEIFIVQHPGAAVPVYLITFA